MLTIALAAALWLGDPRRWVRWLGLLAVVGVSSQGVLGGFRVIADERLLAKIHGCTAPLFFALIASLVTFTSSPWKTWPAGGESPPPSPRGGDARELTDPLSRIWRGVGGEGTLALVLAIAIYIQIIAGAQLRHLTPHEHTFWFALWIWIHVIVAGLLLLGCVWIGIRLGRRGHDPRIVRRARLLAGLMLLQLVLGAATWLTNYGVPLWFSEYVWEFQYTVVAGGAWQAVLTTAHVAVASLLLVTAISLTLWSSRVSGVETEAHANES
jgi:cytochrome c oxidase assembly protein subunit 15